MSTTTSTPSYQEKLTELKTQLEGMFSKTDFAVFNNNAEELGQTYTSPLAVNTGDQAPDFTLPNAAGESINLQALLAKGPVVMTFYRGAWCPYCNLHLNLLQQILPEIKQAGASLVAISPMNPDNTKDMQNTNKLTFEVLSDVGNQVAGQFTMVFKSADEPIKTMGDLGYDFYSFYDDKSAELPVSATFVIDTNGIAVFAESEGGDYRERTEPKAILEALKAI